MYGTSDPLQFKDIELITPKDIKDTVEWLDRNGRCVGTGLLATPDILELLQGAFQCRRCGRCCSQYEAENDLGIGVTENELQQIAAFTHQRRRRIIKLCKQHSSGVYLLPKPCPFFRNTDCVIYRVRPLQCQRYPFRGRLNPDYMPPLNDIPMLDIDPTCPAGKEMAYWAGLAQLAVKLRLANKQVPKELVQDVPGDFTRRYLAAYDKMIITLNKETHFITIDSEVIH